MDHKELGSGGIVTIISGHGESAAFVGDGIGNSICLKLSLDMPLAVGHDIVIWGTRLDYIIPDNPAPGQTVVETAFCCTDEILRGDGSGFGEQVKDHIPKALCRNNAFHKTASLLIW